MRSATSYFTKRTWILIALVCCFTLAGGVIAALAGNPSDRSTQVAGTSAADASCGDVNASGSITSADIIGLVNFVFKGGSAPSCPGCFVASGAVDLGGNVDTPGTGNWSVEYNGAFNRYEITITDVTYNFPEHHTSISPNSGVAMARTHSEDGKLHVFFYNPNGTPVQSSFTFTTITF